MKGKKKKGNQMHIKERPAWWVTSRMVNTINQMHTIRLSDGGFLRIVPEKGAKCK